MPYVKLPPEEFHRRAVETGRQGARRRWGPPKTVDLAGVGPVTRAIILAIIEADARLREEQAAGSAATD